MSKYLRFVYLLSIFVISLPLQSEEEEVQSPAKKEDTAEAEQKPPAIGNFSLPGSQQPAALFGFGGNIIAEGEVQPDIFTDEFVGHKKFAMDIIPGILFGVTDKFSVYFLFPVTPKFRDGPNRSGGPEDFLVQLEYAIYQNSTYTFVDQATLVGNVTVPTGSIKKSPPTGFGGPSFFLGGTFYRTTVQWVFFTSQGAIVTSCNHRSKIGDIFLYQFGLSRTLCSPKGWIYAGMFELTGQYSKKNRFHGKTDPNSGGNVIYATPSLFISCKSFLAHFGISFPVQRNLFGKQRHFDYALNLEIRWSFYKK